MMIHSGGNDLGLIPGARLIKYADGKLSVKFGVLFADEKCANLFEALVGTLKAAKRRKIVTYPGELLLQGVHDNVDILLLQD
ncbi:ABRA C-terminal like [Chelydra serpentina]|uniref:Costars family protein ABRACL n=1 Tax=Chelydra serpentina TaxID=8475 RepID=A0A8T1T7I5_CHESE|nr:ABRA C-terminal like [Chelydra serpentina]